MCQWSRELPCHFQRDVVKVLVVLSQHLDCTLHDLLLKACTLYTLPRVTSTDQQGKQQHNIAYRINCETIENSVHHLHTSVIVLIEDILNKSDL